MIKNSIGKTQMPKILHLTDQTLTQLYTIPVEDWIVIQRRVGIVAFAAFLGETAAETRLPGFPRLAMVCKQWQEGTFQALVDHCGVLNAYAGNALHNFEALQTAIAALPAGPTVPTDVQQQTQTALRQLSEATTPLVAEDERLAGAVHDFMLAHQQTNRELKNKFGDSWPDLTNITKAVDNATGLVNGAFQAIDEDLKNAISDKIDVNMAFLESLDISAAIVDWQRIQTETAAFTSHANDLKQYWQPQDM
jgi:hypothetical protein